MSDEQLVTYIQQGGLVREKALAFLYKSDTFRNPVRAYVLANGGTLDDFKDVFQRALIALDRNIRLGEFEGRSKMSTYFIKIAQWRWQEMRRSLRPTEALTPEANGAFTPPPIQQMLDNKEMCVLLDKALGLLGSPCREMLRMFAFSFSMQEIGENHQQTAEQAKRKVHGCREKARKIILENADLKQRYVELFNRFLQV